VADQPHLIAGILFLAALETIAPPVLTIAEHGGRHEVRVAPLAEAALARVEGPEVLRVIALDPARAVAAAELPALLGDFQVEADALVFRPRFPVAAGLRLEAIFDGAAFDRLTGSRGTPSLRSSFEVVDQDPSSTVVAAIYPSGDEVPANLLRFYLHFSAPMALRDVARQVQLLSADGQSLELPFVELEEGLWDPSRRRLTLIVHPGRIKRGVGPHEALGPVLVPGAEVRLVLGMGARDLEGRPLARAFEKRYRVGPEVRAPLKTADFRVIAPSSSTAALELVATRPLDQALFSRLVVVEDQDGKRVDGSFEVADHEQRLIFRPSAAWKRGRYLVKIDALIEDLAGNRPGRSFEEPESGHSAQALSFEFAVD
jgi:hypothetical protein